VPFQVITTEIPGSFTFTNLVNGDWYIVCAYSNPLGTANSNQLTIHVNVEGSTNTDSEPTTPLKIPGYSTLIILSLIGVISSILILKLRKRNN
jgi:hypothetical protein